MAALIMLNFKYDVDEFNDLEMVERDGKFLFEMFKDNNIDSKVIKNISNIEEEIEKFCKEKIYIEVLYFCYVGHGVDNCKVYYEADDTQPN